MSQPKPQPTPQEIREACQKQYQEKASVLPPEYCLACQGCAIKAIVQGVLGLPITPI